MPEALTSAITVSISPVSGPLRPVPKIASTISVAVGDLAEVQLPRLAVGDLDDGEAEAAEDLEVDARVAAHVGDAAEQEDRRRRCRAAPACARRRSRRRRCCRGRRARRPVLDGRSLERRLHRGDRLAAGVLHQHERRDADVVDRAAIGLAHLRGVQHSHGQYRSHCSYRSSAGHGALPGS